GRTQCLNVHAGQRLALRVRDASSNGSGRNQTKRDVLYRLSCTDIHDCSGASKRTLPEMLLRVTVASGGNAIGTSRNIGHEKFPLIVRLPDGNDYEILTLLCLLVRR